LAERNVPPKAILAGQLYVMAGGQLGSVLIERKVSAANPTLPLRFFQARPADLGQRWAGFRECLDALFASPDTHGPVIEAANLTFHRFIERLETAARSAPASAP
jgi:heme oxygenase